MQGIRAAKKISELEDRAEETTQSISQRTNGKYKETDRKYESQTEKIQQLQSQTAMMHDSKGYSIHQESNINGGFLDFYNRSAFI